jgi:predicted Fe-S protein YdhL (DUF1289 family)
MPPEPETADVPSPCNGICQLARKTRWCRGCGRTASEIGRWPSAGNEEKAKILTKLESRLAALRRR